MSKLSEFVEKNEQYLSGITKRFPAMPDSETDRYVICKPNDIPKLFRDLFDEIEKSGDWYRSQHEPNTLRHCIPSADIRTIFERFTGSDYTQERK